MCRFGAYNALVAGREKAKFYRLVRMKWLFFLLLLPLSAVADEPLGFYGSNWKKSDFSNLAFYRIPYVSQQFCENFLEKVFVKKAVVEGMQALQKQNFESQSESCLHEITKNWASHFGQATEVPPKLVQASESDSFQESEIDAEKLFEMMAHQLATIPTPGGNTGAQSLWFKGKVDGQFLFEYKVSNDETSSIIVNNKLVNYEALSGKSIDITALILKKLDQTKTENSEEEYRERRLAAHFASYLKNGGSVEQPKEFCAAYEKEQERDQEYGKTHPIMRFFTPEQWKYAQDYGLTEAETSAIHMYTAMDFGWINRELRQKSTPSESLKQFLNVTLPALNRIPPYTGVVYRTISSLPEEIKKQHEEGSTVTYDAFSSTTKSDSWRYGQGDEFEIHLKKSGKNIAPISWLPKEEEVLILPGTKFKVLKREPHPANPGYLKFTLEEVE